MQQYKNNNFIAETNRETKGKHTKEMIPNRNRNKMAIIPNNFSGGKIKSQKKKDIHKKRDSRKQNKIKKGITKERKKERKIVK